MVEGSPQRPLVVASANASLEREALAAMRAMRGRIEELEEARREKIAIIGLACRLPGGADDSGSFWSLLSEKKNAVRDIPSDRFDVAEVYDANADSDAAGKTNSRWAGLLERVDEFDAGFFGISPREAENMDPQQRIFLECVWRALEDAAIAPGSVSGSQTGVFVGATTHEYASLHEKTIAAEEIDRYSGVGLALNAIAGRVSYVLGLHGPSMCIDAACASSLVAVDRACRSLRDGECEMALAGGVNVVTFRGSLITAARSGMLSSVGRVDAFGLGADGFVRGEGCGVVVLKRLSAARRDGDRVLAVIAGSAVNHDGPGSGLTVPNGQAQAALLRSALANAGLAPSQVGYVEAHGTGTRLGDPIEAEALGAVFGAGERQRPLAIGSVKTNIGHLEAAAGIAGLIKVVLALEHGELPAQLYGDPPSAHVRWKDLPLEVVRERRQWEPIGGRRIAGVSGFGFSGTNAHVIVEEAAVEGPRAREGSATREGRTTREGSPREQSTLHGAEVLALSAESAASLAMLAQRYAEHLEAHPEQDWGDVCYTAAAGRTHFRHRLAVVASGSAEAAALLRGSVSAGAVLMSASGAASKARDLAEAYVSGAEASGGVLMSAKYAGAAGAGVAGGHDRRRVRLPGYAFERKRHWLSGSRAKRQGARGEPTGLALLGDRLRLAGEGARYEWQAGPTGELAWLGEHRIGGKAILPAAAFVEMLLAAGDRLPGTGEVRVEELSLLAPLQLAKDGSAWPVVQVVVEAADAEDRSRVRFYSSGQVRGQDRSGQVRGGQAGSEWRLHGEGHVSRSHGLRGDVSGSEIQPAIHRQMLATFDAGAVRERCPEVVEAADFYARMEARGAEFGPRFRGVRRIWRGAGEVLGESLGEVLGEVALEAPAASFGYRLHPASFDACLQVAAALLPDNTMGNGAQQWLPAVIEELQYHSSSGLPLMQQTAMVCLVHARLLAPPASGTAEVAYDLYPQNQHQPFATLGKIQFKKIAENKTEETPTHWIFESQWVPVMESEQPAEPPAGDWAIFFDSSGVGAQLVEALAAAGEDAFVIEPGEQYRQVNDHRFSVRAHDREDYSRVFKTLLDGGACANWRGRRLRIVALYTTSAEWSPETLMYGRPGQQLLSYDSFLGLVQALVARRLDAELYVVMTSAQAAQTAEGARGSSPASAAGWSPASAALRALCGTVRAEHPELKIRCIDLAGLPTSGKRLLDLLKNRSEPELMLRAEDAYVPRWTFSRVAGASEDQPVLELRAGTTGLVEDLSYAEVERIAPSDSEVEIEVQATGLNFRDVMKTLKMLDDDGRSLGGECAGVVARAGKNSKFSARNEVVAFAPGAFRSYVTVRASHVVLKPASLSFAEAACLPVAYMTAMLGLDRLARIQAGQTVLIHAAAGGLGQAAVSVAKERGALIFATAGSETKREHLRGQGIQLVMDSRTTQFASQVLEATAGRGVDVVLNSLAGEYIQESFRALASGGCFLETGKRGVLSPEEAARRYPGTRYFCFDLGEEAAKYPELVPSLMRELMDQIENGVLAALPVESVPFRDAAQVFRRMAQAKHIGKLAVTYTNRWQLTGQPGTYLITGGLGALGLGAVDWLFKHGARSFLLLSRNRHPDSDWKLLRYRQSGAVIRVVYGDCAEEQTVRAAVAGITPALPLRGVVHCAGVLHDGVVMDQDWQSFREVAAPKLSGAWNLHRATAELPLDFFALFSSAAATIGSSGQANYAAANAAMDTLAQFRRANGLPALTINWGPWTIGMAARTERRPAVNQLASIDLAAGFAIVEHLLQSGAVQATALALNGVNSEATAQALAQSGLSLDYLERPSERLNARGFSLLAQLAEEPEARRRTVLMEHVRTALLAVSGIEQPEDTTSETAFFDLGVDSLMAVELRNYLMKSLGRTLPATLALDYPTVGNMAGYLSSLVSDSPPSVSKTRAPSDLAEEDISALTEDEAEALLLREMGWPN